MHYAGLLESRLILSRSLPAAKAPDPFRIDDIHPSIRGDKRRPLASRLSNYEFRAYRRSDHTIILHLKTKVLIETQVTFGDCYLSGMTAALRLAGGHHLVLDTLSIGADLAIPFDGQTMGVDAWLPVPTGLKEVRPGFAQLDLRIGWAIAGAPFEARVRSKVVVGRVLGR